jgi:hypothetical protein
MFLHAGNGKNIREKDIIGIFDMDNATISSVTRKFLSAEQSYGLVESASIDIPKSFIIYKTEEGTKVLFSSLSASALLGRI